jgi:uncharacterized membrane protein YeaQ/YmgE (transglycosylase-associated protein family)
MNVELSRYVERWYTHECGVGQIVLLFLVGLFAVWIARKVIPSSRRLGTLATILLGISSTMCGLALTTTTYPCPESMPHGPLCRVVAVGIPFRQQIEERDREPVVLYDVCTNSSEELRAALIADFSLGVLGFPILVLLLLPGRRKE